MMMKRSGINLILINTSKGMQLFNSTKNEMVLEERTIEEARKGNGQLNKPSDKINENIKIREDFIKYGYKRAMNNQKKLKDIFRESKVYYFLRSIKHYIKK